MLPNMWPHSNKIGGLIRLKTCHMGASKEVLLLLVLIVVGNFCRPFTVTILNGLKCCTILFRPFIIAIVNGLAGMPQSSCHNIHILKT